MKISLLLITLISLLLGCTGEESLGVDTIAPNKPELVPHLGNTGDIIPGFQGDIDTLNFYNTYNLYFENNGMDAVMDGDWIKTQWFHFEDSDIDYLRIFRFSAQDYYSDTLNFVQIIDTVDYDNQIYYLDRTSMIGKNYFYFIEVFDNAGNSTLSDTTGYKLIDKPYLISPVDNDSYQNSDDIVFIWERVGYDALQHRLLVFNETRELIWQNTPLGQENFIVPYEGPPIDPGSELIWRVDAIGNTYSTPSPIEGNYYIVESGSESIERSIFIDE